MQPRLYCLIVWLLAVQAFAEVLANNESWVAPMDEVYSMLDIDPDSVMTLESYLKEYYSKILKKLKEVGASSDRTNFYV